MGGRALTIRMDLPAAELRRRGRILADVLSLAEALPSRHEPRLRYPRLDRAA